MVQSNKSKQLTVKIQKNLEAMTKIVDKSKAILDDADARLRLFERCAVAIVIGYLTTVVLLSIFGV